MKIEDFEKQAVIYDVETFPNYFEVGFKMRDGGDTFTFVLSEFVDQADDLLFFLNTMLDSDVILMGYNNHWYDDRMIQEFITMMGEGERDNDRLYRLSVWINGNHSTYSEQKRKDLMFGQRPYKRTWDLGAMLGMERAGQPSTALKELGIEYGYENIVDLPHPFDQPLTQEQADEVTAYNLVDLELTELTMENNLNNIKARLSLIDRYNLTVTQASSHEPKLGMTIMQYLNDGRFDAAPKVERDILCGDYIADDISFNDVELKAALAAIKKTTIEVRWRTHKDEQTGKTGKHLGADKLEMELMVGDKLYKFANGGLHSIDAGYVFNPEDGRLFDVDVTSYYPTIVLNLKIEPEHLAGGKFLPSLSNITKARVDAKNNGDNALADGLKVPINSIYGKLGDSYSELYDTQGQLAVCHNGELYLLMLIEQLEEQEGISIVSANTDGVFALCEDDAGIERMKTVVAEFGKKHRFGFKTSEFESYARRDVNNFVATYKDGEKKDKGIFSYHSQMPEVSRLVLEDALTNGTDILESLKAHTTLMDLAHKGKGTARLPWFAGDAETQTFTQLQKNNRWVATLSGTDIRKLKINKDGTKGYAGVPRMKKGTGKNEVRCKAVILNDVRDIDEASILADIDYENYAELIQKDYDKIANPRRDKNGRTPLEYIEEAHRAEKMTFDNLTAEEIKARLDFLVAERECKPMGDWKEFRKLVGMGDVKVDKKVKLSDHFRADAVSRFTNHDNPFAALMGILIIAVDSAVREGGVPDNNKIFLAAEEFNNANGNLIENESQDLPRFRKHTANKIRDIVQKNMIEQYEAQQAAKASAEMDAVVDNVLSGERDVMPPADGYEPPKPPTTPPLTTGRTPDPIPGLEPITTSEVISLLPETLRNAIVGYNLASNMPLEMVLTCALAVTNFVSQKIYNVDTGKFGHVPLTEFFVVLQARSGGKSSTYKRFTRPVTKSAKKQRASYLEDENQYKGDMKVWEKAMRKMEEGDIAPTQPQQPEYYDPFIPSPTLNGLMKHMGRIPSGGLFSDEGVKFINSYDNRSKESGISLAASLCDIWGGEDLKKTTGMEQENLSGRRCNMLLLIQKAVAGPLVASARNEEQGLESRLLIVSAPEWVRTDYDTHPDLDELLEKGDKMMVDYENRITELHEEAGLREDYDNLSLCPLPVSVSPSLTDRLKKWYTLSSKLYNKSDDFPPVVSGVISKMYEHTLRLAGTIAVYNGVTEIGEDEWNSAEGLMRFFIYQRFEIENVRDKSAMTPRAQAEFGLMEWLKTPKQKNKKFLTGELQRYAPTSYRDIDLETKRKILSSLVDAGMLIFSKKRYSLP